MKRKHPRLIHHRTAQSIIADYFPGIMAVNRGRVARQIEYHVRSVNLYSHAHDYNAKITEQWVYWAKISVIRLCCLYQHMVHKSRE